MELAQFFQQEKGIKEEIAVSLDRFFVRHEYGKGDHLYRIDSRSRKLVFIEKGFGRSYYYKNDKDITHLFFREDEFTMSIDSVFYQQPSPYAFEFLEGSIVKSADFTQVEQYLDQHLELQQFARMLLIDLLKTFSDRLYTLQFQSAEERYQALLAGYPDILLRAPLGHIASYLGITQQTLSVIRARGRVTG